MKTFTSQQIEDALKEAPKLIQDEIADGERTATLIAGLGSNLKLHVDQMGMIAELNRNMLLGLIGPEEFLKELLAAKVSDADAREIMKEINQKIFVPLREKETKKEENPIPTATVPVPPNQEVPAPPSPPKADVPVPGFVPYAQPQRYFHLENKIPFQPGAPRPPREGNQSLLEPAENEILLEDHEEPHMEINKIPIGSVPAQTAPPANLPVATMPAQPKPVSPVPPPPAVSAKPYTLDPYREPIDEGSK